jgi:hypothetical protein
MDDRLLDQHGGGDGPRLTPHIAAVDAALASGDVAAALRAWHQAYGTILGSRRWEGFAEAGDAYLRIARASGSPAIGLARARDLYLSALFRASGAGSLDGVLRMASAFVELGDDEIVAHSLRIARRLAAGNPAAELQERLHVFQIAPPSRDGRRPGAAPG